MVDIHKILTTKFPDRQYTCSEKSNGQCLITYLDEKPPISTEALNKAKEELIVEEANLALKNKHVNARAIEYPSIEDQLDMIFHEGLDTWKATIQSIKDKHPKNLGDK